MPFTGPRAWVIGSSCWQRMQAKGSRGYCGWTGRFHGTPSEDFARVERIPEGLEGNL